jgi:hypothetical protein
MCADRARGLTFAQIGKAHGVSRQFSWWATRHVQVVYVWREWHVVRWRTPPEPLPVLQQVHAIYARGR